LSTSRSGNVPYYKGRLTGGNAIVQGTKNQQKFEVKKEKLLG